MPNLTDPLAALELVNALLPQPADTLTVEPKSALGKGKTAVSALTDAALTLAGPPASGSVGVSAPSVGEVTEENPVQNTNALSDISMSALSGSRAIQPHRDPDPTGCPTHWQGVPELPPKGSRVALVDQDGYGCLYRFKHAGVWYLLKFLPPFDGTLSIRDSKERPYVFPSLEALSRYLGTLEDGFEVTPLT